MKTEQEYQAKLAREASWNDTYDFKHDHFLNSKLLFSFERTLFNYDFPKRQLQGLIRRLVKQLPPNPEVLIAPLGEGQDVPYFNGLTTRITGIDINPTALKNCPYTAVDKHIGDVADMKMFADNQFDMVAMPLFFHHFVNFGFDPFLREAYRVVRPGGFVFSLEPCLYNPISLAALFARKFFGNITSIQPDERPIAPSTLVRSMERVGFENVHARGAGYCHTRVPIFAAKAINFISAPFVNFPLLRQMSFMFTFEGRKPGAG